MSTISVNCKFNKYDVNKISVKQEENCKRFLGKDKSFVRFSLRNYAERDNGLIIRALFCVVNA